MISRVLAVTAMAVGLGVVVAVEAPATAAAADCPNDVVCVYNATHTRTGQYSEYTSHYQSVPSWGIASVMNATGKAVKFRYASGNIGCVLSGRSSDLHVDGYGEVTGIRLVNEDSCVF